MIAYRDSKRISLAKCDTRLRVYIQIILIGYCTFNGNNDRNHHPHVPHNCKLTKNFFKSTRKFFLPFIGLCNQTNNAFPQILHCISLFHEHEISVKFHYTIAGFFTVFSPLANNYNAHCIDSEKKNLANNNEVQRTDFEKEELVKCDVQLMDLRKEILVNNYDTYDIASERMSKSYYIQTIASERKKNSS